MSIKYIFCITSGRSGTTYLTELLSKARNCVSIHEGFPIMVGAPMQQFNEGDEAALRALMPFKMKAIHRASRGNKIYCETNPSYIKGWGYLIPDEYIPQEEIGVIVLRRDVDKTIYSTLRIHALPGASEWTRTWNLCPGARRNLSHPADDAGRYELCKWLVDEVNLRAEAYQAQFPRIKYVECELEQLNDYGYAVKLFDEFGLIPAPALKDVVGKVLNLRNEWPKLPLEELVAPPKYPSADDLPPAERDALLTNMVAYLHEHKAQVIATLEPNQAMGGSLFKGATEVVAQAGRELEERFGYSLMFTDTERILIYELLRSIAPRDVVFINTDRTPPPGIAYRFDFNNVNWRVIVRKQGLMGLLRIVWVMVRGMRPDARLAASAMLRYGFEQLQLQISRKVRRKPCDNSTQP